MPNVKFQPTLPVRGVTVPERQSNVHREISTHTPRAGSDFCLYQVWGCAHHFNPHSPCGE